MWTAGDKNLTYDQAKKDSGNAKKDFKLVSTNICLYPSSCNGDYWYIMFMPL